MATQNIYNLTDTWNDGATTFNAIKMNVTDAASSSSSLLMDLQINGASKFSVSKDGRINIGTGGFLTEALSGLAVYRASALPFHVGNTGIISAGSAGSYAFSSTVTAGQTPDVALIRESAGVLKVTDGSTGQGDIIANSFKLPNGPYIGEAPGAGAQRALVFYNGGDLAFGVNENTVSLNNDFPLIWTSSVNSDNPAISVSLYREADNILAQRNGTNSQEFRVYNTYADATNYERASMGWSGNIFGISQQVDGSGARRRLQVSGFNDIMLSPWAANTTLFSNIEMRFGSNIKLGWGGTTNVASSASDVALARDSAGVLKITDGSTGYGHLVVDTVRINNPINTQTGVLFTPAVSDAERYIRLNNSASITVSVPSDATANIPVGSTITFEQTGTGTVTFVAGSGATVNSRDGLSSTVGQYSVASLIKTAANTFTLTGDLV